MESNFDIIKNIKALDKVYKFCTTAESFQTANPMVSALNARLALETMVKIVYYLKSWPIGERSSLLSLTTDERFTAFLDSDDLLKRIHYIRKVGNNAAHNGEMQVGRRESFFAVLNLYYIVGSIMLSWQIIDNLPPFDKNLIPSAKAQNAPMSVVPAEGKTDKATTEAAKKAAEAVNKRDGAKPSKIAAQPVKNDISEAETRRLYIDLFLREAGWQLATSDHEIIAGRACTEIEVHGMPSQGGTGYADYVLFDTDGTPLAVVEAKRTSKSPEEGRHQAELYAGCLQKAYGCEMPVIYYTNGFEIYVIDGLYPPRKVMGFHTRDELVRMQQKRGLGKISNLTISDSITDRTYQKRVIKSVCGHYNEMHRRALLVMATGTGKTRVAISLTDVMIRNNWVKHALFLADRTELVEQARRNFTKLLPAMSTSSLLDKEPDLDARILFSTYQTMIGHLDKDDKTFSIGRFDLIIIDEAHRSVFGKYGAVFAYFDSLLLGLTATPRDEVERSTYELFGMEQGDPTDSYEYDEAVADGYLVPFNTIIDNSKIIQQGINPDELSKEEQEQLEEIFEYEMMKKEVEYEGGQRQIAPKEIFTYIFNQNTIDHVIFRLMNDGLRVDGGAKVGKSIIFAYNHRHAMLIAERFAALYPELGADFCRVIDNYERYSSDLINNFSTAGLPQIAVSVDMLDTGIDIPEVLNLVFFKPVHSKIKFWQMIGRGTRLCKNLFGDGHDKQNFLIFDFYGNFEFFKVNPDGIETGMQKSVNCILFELRTDLKYALQDDEYQSNEEAKTLHDDLQQIIHDYIAGLNRSRPDVRMKLRTVETYSAPEALVSLSVGDVIAIKSDISPLLKNYSLGDDIPALRFDVLVLRSQLSLVDKNVRAKKAENAIKAAASFLKEKKATIPQVREKMPVINEVLTPRFWNDKSLAGLERIRKELRELMQYLTDESRTFVINVADDFEEYGKEIDIVPVRTYRHRVEDYLKEHFANDAALQKIYQLEPLDNDDIKRLEQIFWQELGTKEEFEAQTKNKPYSQNIGAYVRSLIGVDAGKALEKYRELIHGADLTRKQEEYLRMIVRYVKENGTINTQALQKPPLNAFATIFRDNPRTIIEYVKLVNNAVA